MTMQNATLNVQFNMRRLFICVRYTSYASARVVEPVVFTLAHDYTRNIIGFDLCLNNINIVHYFI